MTTNSVFLVKIQLLLQISEVMDHYILETQDTHLTSPTLLKSLYMREEPIFAFLKAHIPSDIEEWNFIDDKTWRFRYPEVEVHITSAPDPPTLLPLVDVFNRDYVVPSSITNYIRNRLQDIIEYDGPDLVACTGFAGLILHLLEETSSTLLDRQRKAIVTPKGWNVHEVESWKDVVDNPVGTDLSSVVDTTQHILGQTPERICKGLSPDVYRILHVESVLRTDLAKRFLRYQTKMRRTLSDRPRSELERSIPNHELSKMKKKRELVNYLVKPRLTYHGTSADSAHSIVRYGFIKPGGKIGDTGQSLDVRCGSWYGRGIYSSPDPEHSAQYSAYNSPETHPYKIASEKLVVCATILGRTTILSGKDDLRDILQDKSEPMDRSDSHAVLDEGAVQYVVFNEAQIIPCYVIHMDLGVEEARKDMEELPLDPPAGNQEHDGDKNNKPSPKLTKAAMSSSDLECEQAAKQAAASKRLPFGFGPATGTTFVVDEIGETSDDEEYYGEYHDPKQAAATQKRLAHIARARRNHEAKFGKLSIFDQFFDDVHYVSTHVGR